MVTPPISEWQSPLGLIAGAGQLPIEFARRAKEQGFDVVVGAIRGESDERLNGMAKQIVWLRIGQVSKLIRTFKRAGVKQAAFAGGVRRTTLFGSLALDWRAVRILARARTFKDDVLMREVAAEFEREGIQVVGLAPLLDKCIPEQGVLTKRGLSEQEKKDTAIGWEAGRALGTLDIGQTVVAFKAVVVAVEAVEGTDATIRRAGDLTKNRAEGSSGPVVVKLCKPIQDERLDLPTVGEHTILRMKDAGATAIVVEAGKTIIVDPERVVHLADELGIAVVALNAPPEI